MNEKVKELSKLIEAERAELHIESADELENVIKFLQYKLEAFRAKESAEERKKEEIAERLDKNPWHTTPLEKAYACIDLTKPHAVGCGDDFRLESDAAKIATLLSRDEEATAEMAEKIQLIKALYRLAEQDWLYHGEKIGKAVIFLTYDNVYGEWSPEELDSIFSETGDLLTPMFTTWECAMKICDLLNENKQLPALIDKLFID